MVRLSAARSPAGREKLPQALRSRNRKARAPVTAGRETPMVALLSGSHAIPAPEATFGAAQGAGWPGGVSPSSASKSRSSKFVGDRLRRCEGLYRRVHIIGLRRALPLLGRRDALEQVVISMSMSGAAAPFSARSNGSLARETRAAVRRSDAPNRAAAAADASPKGSPPSGSGVAFPGRRHADLRRRHTTDPLAAHGRKQTARPRRHAARRHPSR